ncbi:LysR family transcriptional regulator [Variovorax sp. OV329]|uniref:LysR family transcriptional regulator n=1 Tax=Variovorax sp. OV329 TaxID=1882825 RepID=UPI0008E8F5B0|nr:LysR family transcriptional regulator [Variovorax sp. OV329]SFM92406.1 DNA-binding transcriptional regulator, LysR family [Variovorax sp. OV329]
MSTTPHRSPPPFEISRAALPDLRALETFVVVCGANSMAQAADQLGVTQSAVSQTIKSLEAQHGVRLLDREVRPARPTRDGARLLALSEALLADARKLSRRLHRSASRGRTLIRLGCVDSFAATVGPALVRALSDTAEQLQLWSGLTPGLSAQLQSRELDLAICTEAPVGDARIAQRLLFSERWVLVLPRSMAAPSHLDVAAVRAIAAELPLIRYTQRSVIGQQLERFLRHLGLGAPQRFAFDATDPMLSLVGEGIGWALSTPLCLWQSRAWLEDVQVHPLPPMRLGQREFYLLCRDAEWSELADEIVSVTRTALQADLLPQLRAALPRLPHEVIAVAGAETPSA